MYLYIMEKVKHEWMNILSYSDNLKVLLFQDIGYFEANNGAQVVSLPFEDNDYEMVLVLPPSSDTGMW